MKRNEFSKKPIKLKLKLGNYLMTGHMNRNMLTVRK